MCTLYSLWLAQNATVTLRARSAIMNLTELLKVQVLAQSVKHPSSYGACTGVLAMASAKRDSYPTCIVSNRECDRTADGANIGAIIKIPILVRSGVLALASAKRDSYPNCKVSNREVTSFSVALHEQMKILFGQLNCSVKLAD